MKKYISFLVILFTTQLLLAQNIGIGTTTPDSSAIVDVKSTTKGFLMPRMTTAERDAIVAPKEGLQIYNTDDKCQDTYDGRKWSKNCSLKMNGDVILPAGTWRSKANFEGTSRYAAVGFSIEGKGYIGTGWNESYKKDFWEYDSNLNSWTQKADFGGTAREGAVAFVINSKGYVGTGLDEALYKKDFWEYDPYLNTWNQKTDLAGTVRVNAVGFSLNGKGYVGTGSDGGGSYKKDFWEYDPSLNTWTQKADFGGTPRKGAVGFSIASKGYIGTGSEGVASYKKDFWEFTPAGNGPGSWIQKTSFSGTARDGAVGFSINSKGYIGTGLDGSFKADFWEYDANINTWVQISDFGGARNKAVGFSIGSKGYFGTGSFNNDFWEYNTLPESGKEYIENIPSDAIIYKGHDWTSSGNNLYTTLENGNTITRGLLNADEGIRVKHSGSIVISDLAINYSTFYLPINPPAPIGWNSSNTMIIVSVADDPYSLKTTIYEAYVTSPDQFKLTVHAQIAGQIRLNYIIFKL
jgi:N-acetylneuraminic acid mutarotase